MLNKLMQTEDSFSLLFVRLAMGIVFFAHGAQKVLGWLISCRKSSDFTQSKPAMMNGSA